MIGSFFFMKKMSSGIIFSEIFGFVGNFFVSFCVSGTSFDVFGALRGPGRQNPGQHSMPLVAFGLHFGSLF